LTADKASGRGLGPPCTIAWAGGKPEIEGMAQAAVGRLPTSQLYYRHALPVRIMHWTNVLCLSVLFMSG